VTTDVMTDTPAVLQAVAEAEMSFKAAPEIEAADVPLAAGARLVTEAVALRVAEETEGAFVPEAVTVEVSLTVLVTVARLVDVDAAADWSIT
jgi:hypothetical protein